MRYIVTRRADNNTINIWPALVLSNIDYMKACCGADCSEEYLGGFDNIDDAEQFAESAYNSVRRARLLGLEREYLTEGDYIAALNNQPPHPNTEWVDDVKASGDGYIRMCRVLATGDIKYVKAGDAVPKVEPIKTWRI